MMEQWYLKEVPEDTKKKIAKMEPRRKKSKRDENHPLGKN